MNDVVRVAERVKKSIDDELKKDPSVARQTRTDGETMAAEVLKDAKELHDRIGDSEPSSAQADRLLAVKYTCCSCASNGRTRDRLC